MKNSRKINRANLTKKKWSKNINLKISCLMICSSHVPTGRQPEIPKGNQKLQMRISAILRVANKTTIFKTDLPTKGSKSSLKNPSFKHQRLKPRKICLMLILWLDQLANQTRPRKLQRWRNTSQRAKDLTNWSQVTSALLRLIPYPLRYWRNKLVKPPYWILKILNKTLRFVAKTNNIPCNRYSNVYHRSVPGQNWPCSLPPRESQPLPL